MKSGLLFLLSTITGLSALSLPALAADEYVIAFGGTAGDWAGGVIETSDGGFVVSGWTASYGAGDSDVLLAKFNASGVELWTRTLGGTAGEGAYDVIETSDGGFVVSGWTASYGAGGYDALLAKFDGAGNHAWTRTLGGTGDETAQEVIEASDGGLVVAGSTGSYGEGDDDILVAKFNASGTHLWTRTLGGSDADWALGLVEASDGGLVVSGITVSYAVSERDHLLAKLDSSGNLLWARTMGGTYPYWGYGGNVVETSDTGLVITGGQNHWGVGTWDIVLAKFNASGTHLWTKTLGGTGTEWGYCYVTELNDGGLAVTQRGAPVGHDLLVAKFDGSGTYLWTWVLGGAADERGRRVMQTSDNGLLVLGSTESFGAGSSDILLSKHDPLGHTCLGSYVAASVTTPSPTINEPEPPQSSPTPEINSPDPTVTSPSPSTEIVCRDETAVPSVSVLGGLILLSVSVMTGVWLSKRRSNKSIAASA